MGSLAMDTHLSGSEASSSPPDTTDYQAQLSKRTASDAGLKATGPRPAKSVKRRASKACQCCRARKVRCNVVEHGPPCTNCRLDEVECVVSESKRKKKWTTNPTEASAFDSPTTGMSYKPAMLSSSAQPPYQSAKRPAEHVPHALCSSLSHAPSMGHIILTRSADQDLDRDISASSHSHSPPALFPPNLLMELQRQSNDAQMANPVPMMPRMITPVTPSYSLPLYVKPLPSKLSPEDIMYLERKGALTIPSPALRDELLKSYAEFVHPFMPMLNLIDLVKTIDRNDGASPISLLLFQAIMFCAIATVNMQYLKKAGYSSRREARRHFFQRTRLLYDFDIEADRIALIQSLLLMTFWYETPDDQKDSHHWMGIAVSLSHTIGLHRNPEKSTAMDDTRKRLWKRIWWSIYIRDRLVALGMRRPTRIKNVDFDVPMLTLDDFDMTTLPEGQMSCIPWDCKVLRDADMQRQLAIMCIEKTKLCVCMSHVLSAQYSVLNNNHGIVSEEGSTATTVRLVARKRDPEVGEVQACDKELRKWLEELPEGARYVVPSWHDIDAGRESIVLNLSLLHMIFFATLSALHRPQVLPSTTAPPRATLSEMLEHSRREVRHAATEITAIATGLYNLDLARFLPTSGITVLLPAIIIHLLDIKAPEEATRRASLQGFCQCMQVMARLRDIYAAADYSTAFLEAAIRKAEITIPQKSDEVKDPRNVITSAQMLVDAGRRLQLVTNVPETDTLTPPPDSADLKQPLRHAGHDHLTDDDIARKLNSYLASTPPGSEQTGDLIDPMLTGMSSTQPDLEPDFDSLINLDAAGDVWSLEDGAYAAMGGESGGFVDLDWLRGIKETDGIGDEMDISVM